MAILQPIPTAPAEFSPSPITDEEAAAMFRAALNLFGKWDLTDDQAATLLDMPVRSYRRWKAEGPGRARNVIIEFESLAAAHDCYHSPEYQRAVAIRQKVADGEIVLVEGI